jgi:isopenicillin-N epimerase
MMLTVDSKRLFPLDPNLIYLNHGAFGVTPHDVLNEKRRILSEIEKNPVDFLQFKISERWQQIANTVAKRFLCDENSVAIVDNATDGAVAVLRALSLKPTEEILITQLTYNAISLAARHIAETQGARVNVAMLRFPDPDPQQFIEAVQQALTPRTRLAILDHITSSTALLMPLKEMIDACRARGIPVLVDGAHAPGQIELDIPGLGADWYVANLHKWYFVPRGCGFLWAAASARTGLMPTVLSSDIAYPFPYNFGWTGTRDPSSWLAILAGFDFMDRFGEAQVRGHNHGLLGDGIALLIEMWKSSITIPDRMRACMSVVSAPDGLPYPPTDQGRALLELDLKERCNIIVSASIASQGHVWLRITAQIYNDIRDYEKLGRAILSLR